MGTGSPLGACSFKAANDETIGGIVANRKFQLDTIAAPLCTAQQSGHTPWSQGALCELCVATVPTPSGMASAIKSPANTDNVRIARKTRMRLWRSVAMNA